MRRRAGGSGRRPWPDRRTRSAARAPQVESDKGAVKPCADDASSPRLAKALARDGRPRPRGGGGRDAARVATTRAGAAGRAAAVAPARGRGGDAARRRRPRTGLRGGTAAGRDAGAQARPAPSTRGAVAPMQEPKAEGRAAPATRAGAARADGRGAEGSGVHGPASARRRALTRSRAGAPDRPPPPEARDVRAGPGRRFAAGRPATAHADEARVRAVESWAPRPGASGRDAEDLAARARRRTAYLDSADAAAGRARARPAREPAAPRPSSALERRGRGQARSRASRLWR